MDVVKILLSNGADINLGQSTPLMEASQEGHIELVQYLIENGIALVTHRFFSTSSNSSLLIGAHVQQKTRTEDTGKFSSLVIEQKIHPPGSTSSGLCM